MSLSCQTPRGRFNPSLVGLTPKIHAFLQVISTYRWYYTHPGVSIVPPLLVLVPPKGLYQIGRSIGLSPVHIRPLGVDLKGGLTPQNSCIFRGYLQL